MTRKSRIHYPGAVYHAILRGNNKQTIFFSDEDRTQFCLFLQETIEQYDCRIHGFCLMTNHVHLAVQVNLVPLSKNMQSLCTKYARWINWRYQRVGHLFQGRYKAILVEINSYLVELIRYIHLNPVRAKLVEQAKDYSWSGHKTYLGLEEIPWLTTDWVLSTFAEDRQLAQKHYKEFILAGDKKNYKQSSM